MKVTSKELTIEEKVKLVKGASFFRMAGVEEKGIEGLLCLDGGTGINFEQLFGDFCSTDEEMQKYFGSKTLRNVIESYYAPEKLNEEETKLHGWITERLKEQCKQEVFAPGCFPAGILMGSTWNPKMVHDVADALGKEAAAYGIDLLLGTPYVNLIRDPLSGRLFEGYGEDPYLMTVLAPEAVKGVQEQGVAANVKHFAANNQESFRVGINEIITKRTLFELYFPAFKACVEADVATVMSAYNQINGVPCTENQGLLKDLLRDEWGFEGAVVSDWGAVKHLDLAVEAGNDIAMPGPVDGTALVSAIENRMLTEEKLDEAVDHVLAFMEKCRKLKSDAVQKDIRGHETEKQIDTEERSANILIESSDCAAYKAALEGIVLLKNDNDIFPLTGDVSLFGEGAKKFYDCGTGSAGITTDRSTSLLEELRNIKDCAHVTFEEITPQTETILVVGRKQGMEGNDHKDLFLPKEEQQKILDVVAMAKEQEKKVGVILNVCGPVDCSTFADQVDGIFCVFLPGMQGAKALADLLVGKENPSGRLTVTFPRRYEDTPTYLNFPGDGYHTIYGEDIFVGYRYYDTKKIKTLYPFGYGLSYTTFVYGSLQVDADVFTDEVTCSVEVTNTGKYTGKEVVMLFVADKKSTLRKPQKELKGFEKIELKPGETRQVSFTITKEMLFSYDMNLNRWEAEEGYYDLIIARSAEGIVCSKTVYGEWNSAYSYTLATTVKVLHDVKAAWELLFTIFKKYGLDVGRLEDTYEYNSHTPIEEVICNAVEKCNDKQCDMVEQIFEDVKNELKLIKKE